MTLNPGKLPFIRPPKNIGTKNSIGKTAIAICMNQLSDDAAESKKNRNKAVSNINKIIK